MKIITIAISLLLAVSAQAQTTISWFNTQDIVSPTGGQLPRDLTETTPTGGALFQFIQMGGATPSAPNGGDLGSGTGVSGTDTLLDWSWANMDGMGDQGGGTVWAVGSRINVAYALAATDSVYIRVWSLPTEVAGLNSGDPASDAWLNSGFPQHYYDTAPTLVSAMTDIGPNKEWNFDSELPAQGDWILIPEPGTLAIFGMGALVIWLRRRRLRG